MTKLPSNIVIVNFDDQAVMEVEGQPSGGLDGLTSLSKLGLWYVRRVSLFSDLTIAAS